MSVSNIELLNHILDELSFVKGATTQIDKDHFIEDPVLTRAVIRSIEIIGEANNKLHPDFRLQYPHIELPDLHMYVEEIINELTEN